MNKAKEKRFKAALSSGQPRHGTCVICGKSFDDCEHSIGDVNEAIKLYKLLKAEKWLK